MKIAACFLLLCVTAAAFAQQSRDCTQDGLVVNDGTDQSAHFQACKNNAVANNQGTLLLPCGTFKINTSFNGTNSSSLKYKGCGAHNNGAGGDPNTNTTQINCNTGNRPCMDFTGSSWVELENVGFNSLQSFSNPSTPSQVILLFGRDNAGGGGGANPICYGQFNTLRHVNINTDTNAVYNGGYGYIGIYNIGAEIMSIYDSNISTDSPAWFSDGNDMSITSAYQTLQSGCPPSMSGLNSHNTWWTFGAGPAITLNNAAGFIFTNGGFIPGFGTKSSVFNVRGTSSRHLHIKESGVERLAGDGQPNHGSVFLISVTTIEDWDIDMNAQTNGANSLIQYSTGSTGTCKSCRIRINTLNPAPGSQGQLFSSPGGGSLIFKGGEIDFINSTSPVTGVSNFTLLGTIIKGPGFTDNNIGTFAAGSSYLAQTDDGNVFHGPVGFK
jgi:hypothetical protein